MTLCLSYYYSKCHLATGSLFNNHSKFLEKCYSGTFIRSSIRKKYSSCLECRKMVENIWNFIVFVGDPLLIKYLISYIIQLPPGWFFFYLLAQRFLKDFSCLFSFRFSNGIVVLFLIPRKKIFRFPFGIRKLAKEQKVLFCGITMSFAFR